MSEQEIVVRDNQQSVVDGHHGRLYPTKEMRLVDCPSNIDASTIQGKAMLLAAGNPGDLEFVEGKVRICATHFVVFPEERPDPETGEIHTFARTVLFDRQGRSFRTTSAHAPHRIQAALDLFGPDDWANGVSFVIRERMSAKTKRIYHDIRLDVEFYV